MFLALTLAIAALSGPNEAAGEGRQNDARLNDVCFVDARQGWAVGDRGVILHTDDGGQRWSEQTSGVPARCCRSASSMSSLAGRPADKPAPTSMPAPASSLRPATAAERGRNHPNSSCPSLRRIGFFDPHHGWAIGCRSSLYPAGVLLTDDGGRSWRSLPGDEQPGLAGRRFPDAARGGIGRPPRRAGHRPPRPDRVASPAEGFGVAGVSPDCGSAHRRRAGWWAKAGWCEGATTCGATWQAPAGRTCRRRRPSSILPPWPSAGRSAGSPARRAAASSTPPTPAAPGRPLPPARRCRCAIAFVDDQHGWAVGELGTVLATGDGGQTWRSQRAGGGRAALLILAAEPDDVPLELVARSGRQRRLSHGRRRARPPRPGGPAARRRPAGRSAARGGGGRRRLGGLPRRGSSPCGRPGLASAAADRRGVGPRESPRRHGGTACPAGPRKSAPGGRKRF